MVGGRRRGAGRRPFLSSSAAIVGIALIGLGLYKLPEFSLPAVWSKSGLTSAVGLALFTWGLLTAIAEWYRAHESQRRLLRCAAFRTFISITVTIIAAETGLQLMTVKTSEAVSIGDITFSTTWEEAVKRNVRLLEQATPTGSWNEPYLVFDPYLGWVVGEDRATADGLYQSSVEGIRSPQRGVRYADRRPAHRIAILGNSNAFALEVSFEDSWGYQVENHLGQHVQVLNFGVNGYGLDQAVLRYEKDVRKWSPDLVILAFIQHDLIRSMSVYPFLTFPTWELPLAKPRFIVEQEDLIVVNTPLPDPKSWFRNHRPSDLPYIDLDLSYRAGKWRRLTNVDSLLVRLFATLYPWYPSTSAQISEGEIISLNAALLKRFNDDARDDEATPLLVYVPTRGAGDFEPSRKQNLALQTLALAELPYIDLSDCLRNVPEDRRLVASGGHLSPLANREMAGCLLPVVRQLLREK